MSRQFNDTLRGPRYRFYGRETERDQETTRFQWWKIEQMCSIAALFSMAFLRHGIRQTWGIWSIEWPPPPAHEVPLDRHVRDHGMEVVRFDDRCIWFTIKTHAIHKKWDKGGSKTLFTTKKLTRVIILTVDAVDAWLKVAGQQLVSDLSFRHQMGTNDLVHAWKPQSSSWSDGIKWPSGAWDLYVMMIMWPHGFIRSSYIMRGKAERILHGMKIDRQKFNNKMTIRLAKGSKNKRERVAWNSARILAGVLSFGLKTPTKIDPGFKRKTIKSYAEKKPWRNLNRAQ